MTLPTAISTLKRAVALLSGMTDPRVEAAVKLISEVIDALNVRRHK